MKTGAAILGIVGGAIALIIGVISFFLGSLSETLGIAESTGRQVLSIVIPVVALVGGGIARSSGIVGGILMLASAVAILLILEISVFSLITAIPIGLGAILAFAGAAAKTE
ncbi:MAG: hypothetical protein ACLFST_00520 [Spirochaetia bacterium]